MAEILDTQLLGIAVNYTDDEILHHLEALGLTREHLEATVEGLDRALNAYREHALLAAIAWASQQAIDERPGFYVRDDCEGGYDVIQAEDENYTGHHPTWASAFAQGAMEGGQLHEDPQA
jgi:hypothetical protein